MNGKVIGLSIVVALCFTAAIFFVVPTATERWLEGRVRTAAVTGNHAGDALLIDAALNGRPTDAATAALQASIGSQANAQADLDRYQSSKRMRAGLCALLGVMCLVPLMWPGRGAETGMPVPAAE